MRNWYFYCLVGQNRKSWITLELITMDQTRILDQTRLILINDEKQIQQPNAGEPWARHLFFLAQPYSLRGFRAYGKAVLRVPHQFG